MKLVSIVPMIIGSILIISTSCTKKKVEEGLVIAWESEPRAIDPRFAIDANSQYLENMTHCSLIGFNENGAIENQLGQNFNWKNNKTLEVTLKSPLLFSNGSPVTSKDVKATYDFFLKKDDNQKLSPRAGAFSNIEKIEASNPAKVIFHLKEPDSTFISNLVVGVLPVSHASKDQITSPIQGGYCGPYELSETSTTKFTLRENPHYALSSKPKSKIVTIKFVADESTRLAKLQKGEIDIVQNLISRDALENLEADYPNLEVKKRAGLNTTYLGFNMRDKLAGNIAVRRAIAHAINKKEIIDFILRGYATQASTMLTKDDPYFSDNISTYNLDIEKAKIILDQAGFKDPDGDGPKPRFKISYKTTTNTTRVAIAKAIANQLKTIGIDVVVESLEWGRFKEDVEKGRIQMWTLSWIGFKDPDIYRYAFSSESFPPNGGNRGFYKNKKLDKILASARSEISQSKRKSAYKEVQQIVSEELPYIFLWHEDLFAVLNKDVEGFTVYADGRYGSIAKTYKK